MCPTPFPKGGNSSVRMHKDTQIQRGTHQRASFLICLPTFGLLPVEWVVSYTRLAIPVNAITHSHVITNQEIGVARNEFARVALSMNPQPKAIFFVGDDVLYPWDALLKLWDAFVEYDADVMAGLYFIKNRDYPIPILWRRDIVGPMREYRDYQPGEVVRCDVVGMDATLINPRIFKKIDEPYFKTGPTQLPNGFLSHTEDVWVLDKVKAAGGRIFCHTGVRCSHMDHKTGEIW